MLKNDRLHIFDNNYPHGTTVDKDWITKDLNTRVLIKTTKTVSPTNTSKLGHLGVTKIVVNRNFTTKAERGPLLKFGNPIKKVAHKVQFFSGKELLISLDITDIKGIKIFYEALKDMKKIGRRLNLVNVLEAMKRLR